MVNAGHAWVWQTEERSGQGWEEKKGLGRQLREAALQGKESGLSGAF